MISAFTGLAHGASDECKEGGGLALATPVLARASVEVPKASPPKLAVILAAGIGKRFGEEGKKKPKGFIELEERCLIDYSLEALLEGGIERVLIITGHCSEFYEALAAKRKEISCIKNPFYADALGPMSSLYEARGVIQEDFLLLDSDIVYLSKSIRAVLGDPHPNLLLATTTTDSGDEYYIEVNKDHCLEKFGTDPATLTVYGEQASIARISLPAYRDMCDFYAECQSIAPGKSICYNDALLAVKAKYPVYVLLKAFAEYPWTEIDNHEQYARAVSYVLPLMKKVKMAE